MRRAMLPWWADAMRSFLNKYHPGYLPAFLWLALSTYLFCAPGQVFPDSDWLIQINFDKLVHFGIFSVQVFLACWGYKDRNAQATSFLLPFLLFTGLAISFGIVIEFLQDGYIPNRTFQVGDIVADSLGSAIGFGFSLFVLGKK